mgnify:CR=1 FL=1
MLCMGSAGSVRSALLTSPQCWNHPARSTQTPTQPNATQDSNWRSRESAILALGAISHGCHQGLQPYLEGMVTMLLPALQDARPMVRIITCWTLGRYSHWLFVGKVSKPQELLMQLVSYMLPAVLLLRLFDATCGAEEA